MPNPIPVEPTTDELASFPEASLDVLASSDGPCRHQLIAGSETSTCGLFPPGKDTYDGEMDAPGSWRDSTPALRPLHVVKVKDVYYYPACGALLPSAGGALNWTIEEAVYSFPRLLGLPFIAERNGRVEFTPPSSIRRVDKALITLPLGGLYNYGHYLLDCLTGIAALKRAGVDHYPLIFPPLKDWHVRHLQLLNVDSRQLQDDVLFVEEAYYTSCMAHFLHRPNAIYHDVRNIQLRSALRGKRLGEGRRIYMSRRGNPKRRFLSEDILEKRLRSIGFHVIAPGEMKVENQIEAFYDACVIVGQTGAEFANALYCRPDTIVVEVQPDRMQNSWVRKLCGLMSCRYAAYFCKSTVLLETNPEAGMEYDFSVDRFMSTLASWGVR